MKWWFKINTIANLCFLITVVMRYLELHSTEGSNDQLIRLPFLQSVVVILGYGAILLNVAFLLIWLLINITTGKLPTAKWMLWVVLVCFVLQLIYFFVPQLPI